MAEIGIEDFGMKDLIRPEPVRLRIVLSAIINFAKFREEQLGLMDELNRKSEELSEKHDSLLKRKTDLTILIQSIE